MSGGDEIMNYGQDTLANCVIDDTYTFYVRKTEKGEWIYDVFRLNIDTMESGSEIGEIDFDKSYLHLIADTSDWFIGRKLPDSIEGYMGGNPYTFYKISKEDYYNGDWEKAVKLHL